MSNLRAWLHLFNVGRVAGRRGAGRGLRPAALLCASLTLACAAGLLVAGFAVYDGRDQRGSARAPQHVSSHSENATVAYKEAFDKVDGVQRSVIYLEPLASDAPLPPGVSSWPRAGRAYLSPALARDLANSGEIDRYGTFTGTIATSGLEVPGERLAYVRAPQGTLDISSMNPASGFGNDQPALFGDRQQTHPLSTFEFLAIGMVLFPAVLLTVIAARCAAAERDRRLALLQAMGAPPWARAAASLGEAALPVVTGTVGAAVLAAFAMTTDWQLPYVAFTVPAADLRHWAPEVFLAIAATGAAMLATVTVMNRPNRQTTSPRPGPSRHFRARRVAWLCPLFAILATRASDVTTGPDGMVNQLAFTCLYTLGVLGALATLPAVIAVVAKVGGRRLADLGIGRGRAAALVAGRWMQAHSGVTARLVASVVVAIGLVTQIQLHSSRMDGPARAALATDARLGNSLLTIRVPAREDGISELADHLPPGIHLLAAADNADSLRLTGDCAALKTLNLQCADAARGSPSDPRLKELADWSGYPPTRPITWHKGQLITNGTPPREIVAFSENGRDLPVAALKKAAYQYLPSSQILTPGGEYLSVEPLRKAAEWTVLMGVAGVGMMVFGGIVNNIGDFLRLGRTLAPISVLVGRRKIFYATAAWTVAAPLVVAAGLGTLLAMLLGAPLTQHLGAVAHPGGIAMLAAVTLSGAAAAWWWASVTSTRAASRFSPATE